MLDNIRPRFCDLQRIILLDVRSTLLDRNVCVALVFICETHELTRNWMNGLCGRGGESSNVHVDDNDVDDDERKSRKFLWLYLFSNLTTIKYELLKVNSHLLCSHLIGLN